jgi:hypothetical protein
VVGPRRFFCRGAMLSESVEAAMLRTREKIFGTQTERVRKAQRKGQAGAPFALVRFGFRVWVAGAQANFDRRILWQHYFSSARQKI